MKLPNILYLNPFYLKAVNYFFNSPHSEAQTNQASTEPCRWHKARLVCVGNKSYLVRAIAFTHCNPID